MSQITAIERAHAAWDEALPGWVEILAEACDRTTQSAVAAEISYSTTVISRVIAAQYKGDYSAVEMAVQGAYMGAEVECPVLGPLATNRCLEEQQKPYAATNPTRVKLFSACRSCQHRRGS